MTIFLLFFNIVMCALNCIYGYQATFKDDKFHRIMVYVHFAVAFGAFIAVLMMIHLLLMGIG